jgi:hypothetical protein
MLVAIDVVWRSVPMLLKGIELALDLITQGLEIEAA